MTFKCYNLDFIKVVQEQFLHTFVPTVTEAPGNSFNIYGRLKSSESNTKLRASAGALNTSDNDNEQTQQVMGPIRRQLT